MRKKDIFKSFIWNARGSSRDNVSKIESFKISYLDSSKLFAFGLYLLLETLKWKKKFLER